MTGDPTVSRRLRATVIVGVLALTAGFEVQSATAALRWSKPAKVSKTNCRNGPATKVQAAQNARGDALVAWTEECGNVFGRWRVMAVSRKAGHRLRRPRIIHSGGRAQSIQLGIALDARGGGTIAWTRVPAYISVTHPDSALLVSTRRPGGRFSRPRMVDEHGGFFDLAANPAGQTFSPGCTSPLPTPTTARYGGRRDPSSRRGGFPPTPDVVWLNCPRSQHRACNRSRRNWPRRVGARGWQRGVLLHGARSVDQTARSALRGAPHHPAQGA